MDKNRAHDIVHQWNGNKAENCPSCTGKMKDAEVLTEAQRIAHENYRPKVDPKLPYENRLMTWEEENKKGLNEDVPTDVVPEQAFQFGEPDMRAMVDVLSLSEVGKDSIPTVIKVIPVGKYKMNGYGDVNITKSIIDDMVKNFEKGVRAGGKKAGLPIDIEHGTTQYKDAAAGWIKNLEARSDGGYAHVEWTTLGKQLLKDKIYKFYSPEYWFNYTDPEQNDIKLTNVMTGGGLVNKPMIKHDLNPIVNDENGREKDLTKNQNAHTIYLTEEKTSMKLSEILLKAKSERTSEEQAFVAANKDQMTFAEAKTEGFAADATTETPKIEDKGIKLAEGQIVVDKAQMDGLIALAEAGKGAAEEIKKAKLKEEVKALVFSEKGTKLPADQVDTAVNLLMKMSEEDAIAYKAQLKALPEKAIFAENGHQQENTTGDAAAQDLTAKIQKYQEEHKGVDYATAATAVMNENAQQYSEYTNNLPVAPIVR